jgi:hypothetical protein
VRTAARLLAPALALAVCAPALAAAPPGDPWRALDQLRRELAAAGALSADFVQTYTPAGFAGGESESGRLALSAPDCLRFDYVEPYRKSFLVCGSRAWSWVEGEPQGQRITIEANREMGLDLLLLPAARLAERYRASSSIQRDGALAIALEPRDPDAPLVAADLVLEPGGARPAALDYRDREGNVTSFRFSNWRALGDAEAFTPPADVEWSEP